MKDKLLSMLDEISHGFNNYAENLEDEDAFWEPFIRMCDYIRTMETNDETM